MSVPRIKHFGIFLDRYYWLTAVLIARNGLARQYRNSFLGMLWTLFQPLTMVFIYVLVMPMIMKNTTTNYALYMIVSITTWGFFSGAIFGSSQSILGNGETLKRCMVSSTIFPIADVLRFAYTYFISFSTMYSVAIIFGIAPLSPMLLLVPVFFIPVLIIVCALSVAIAFVAPYLRDIGDLVMVAMNMLFWLTPVVYNINILPAWAQQLMQFNPFYIMLHPIQMLAYEHVMPGAYEIGCLFIVATIAVIMGFSIFKTCRRNYVYYL